jgi:pimeloyl-ACP methyl ester carboxylesterase
MGSYIDQAVNAVIRPPRKTYDPAQIPVFFQGSDGASYVRHPVAILTDRQERIVGSLYTEANRDLMGGLPCVVYMHGNSSCQLEGQFLFPSLCRFGIAVYMFDFAGCGASSGEFISLGHYEAIDALCLIQYLRTIFQLGPFVVWGRSMGAATALMLRHPLICGRIVDSSYSSILAMIKAIARQMKIPSILCPLAVWLLKSRIVGKAHFDMAEVAPLESGRRQNNVPILMCHAIDDEFIPVAQSADIFDAYASDDKQLIRVTGGHNGRRPVEWLDAACRFALRMLDIEVPPGFRPVRMEGITDADHHFASFDELLRAGAFGQEQISPNEPAAPRPVAQADDSGPAEAGESPAGVV